MGVGGCQTRISTLVFQVALVSDVSALDPLYCHTSRLLLVEKVSPTAYLLPARLFPKLKDGTSLRLGAPSSVGAGLTDGVRKEGRWASEKVVVAIAVSSKSGWTAFAIFMLFLPANGRHCHEFVMSRLSEQCQSLDFTLERCRRQQSHHDS